MVQINFAQKQVNAKIVYYGPGMSGKTTNLEVIHQRAPEANRGDLTSISTDGDRTLFFDFMPLDLGMVAGMRTCFQVYTVPGQVYYSSTRKLVLQGVDGVIFIADSSPNMMEENLESMRDLEANLAEYGRSADEIPLVIQYNKRDVPGALPIEVLEEKLNVRGVPAFEGIANTGQGVFPTLKAVAAAVLDSLHKQSGQAAPAPAPAPASTESTPAPASPAASIPVSAPTPAVAAEPAAPLPTSEPVAPAAESRQTISMSQTGFHKAPSLPLQGAVPPGNAGAEVQPPQPATAASAPESSGLQMKAPEPVASTGGLQMAMPTPPAPAPEPQSAQPQLRTQTTAPSQPSMAPTQVAQPTAVATPAATQAPAPSSIGSVMGAEGATAPQRRTPATKSFAPRPAPVQATPKSSKKKSAAMTFFVIVASVGVGAALGSFVLTIL